MSKRKVWGGSKTPQIQRNTVSVRKMPCKVIKLTTLSSFDRSNFLANTDSGQDLVPFYGYRQKLTKPIKSPYSRLGWN